MSNQIDSGELAELIKTLKAKGIKDTDIDFLAQSAKSLPEASTIAETLIILHNNNVNLDNNIKEMIKDYDAAYILGFVVQKGLFTQDNKKILTDKNNIVSRIRNVSDLVGTEKRSFLTDDQWRKLFKEPERFDSLVACIKILKDAKIDINNTLKFKEKDVTIFDLLIRYSNNADAFLDALKVLKIGGKISNENITQMFNNGINAYEAAVKTVRIENPTTKKDLLDNNPILREFYTIRTHADSLSFNIGRLSQNPQSGLADLAIPLANLPVELQIAFIVTHSREHISEQSAQAIAQKYFHHTHNLLSENYNVQNDQDLINLISRDFGKYNPIFSENPDMAKTLINCLYGLKKIGIPLDENMFIIIDKIVEKKTGNSIWNSFLDFLRH